MDAKSLNSEQCQTVSNYLRCAAARFNEFSELALQPPANSSLAAQFKYQHEEAMKLADVFAGADFVHVGND